MPIYYERDDDRQRIVQTSVGELTLADMLGSLNRQAAEGTWSYCVLHDARAITNSPSPTDLHQILLRVGELTTRHGPRGRVAVVVAGRGRALLGERFSELSKLAAQDIRMFGTIDEAERWLDTQEAQGSGLKA